MKVENMKRAINAKQELEALDLAITDMEKKKGDEDDLGFYILKHRDRSGFNIDVQFKENRYHPMYKEILEFTLNKFKEARKDLMKEIESL